MVTVSEQQVLASGEATRHGPQGKLTMLALSALGVVLGDIGTSPLYTFKTILGVAQKSPDTAALGALSLVLWTLFIITASNMCCLRCASTMTGRVAFLP